MRILFSILLTLLFSSQLYANDLIKIAIEQSIAETSASITLSGKIIDRIENENPEKEINKKVLKKELKPWLKALDKSTTIILKNSTSIYESFEEDEDLYNEHANKIESPDNVVARIFDYSLETKVYWKKYFKANSSEGGFYNAQTAITRLSAQLPVYMKYLKLLESIFRS